MQSEGSAIASVALVSLIVISGVGYACTTTGNGGSPSPSLNLEVTSLSMVSGPHYTVFTLLTSLPTSAALFKVGPFAPGDTVVVSYTVENTGSLPATLSTLGVSVTPYGNGFSASNGPIPAALGPGSSFSSTTTIVFKSGLGDSYERSTATVLLGITGTATTSTLYCTTTLTHTQTQTVTTTKTVIITKTVTVTKTTTKVMGSPAGENGLWLTTSSSCTTLTATVTVTITVTHTVTTTTTTTKTVTTTTTSCTKKDDCKS